MSSIEFKKHKENYEVNLFQASNSQRRKKAIYHNVIDRNPKKIAQVLIDLEVLADFPVYKAVKLYLKLRSQKDWLGF